MIHWEEPWFLFGLLVLPLSLAIGFLLLNQVKSRLKKLGKAKNTALTLPMYQLHRVFWRHLFLGLAGALLALALARPQWGQRTVETERKGMYLVLALDVSQSMLAEDVKPNRLYRAKQAAIHWLDDLKNDRLALVVFAATAQIQMPMTSDYGAARLYLESVDQLKPDLQGTSLNEALTAAYKAIPKEREADAAVILISDGEDHEGKAMEMAAKMAEEGIEVHTLSVGLNQAVPIPDGKGYLKDEAGRMALTKPNKQMLAQLADVGGGTFADDPHPEQGLNRIFAALEEKQRESFSSEIKEEGREEHAGWFVAAALVLLCIELFWKNTRKPQAKVWTWFGNG